MVSGPSCMTILTTSTNDFARLNLKQLIGDYDAILDTPTTQIFPFLLAAFPRARVIHTVRDSLAWLVSSQPACSSSRGWPHPFCAGSNLALQIMLVRRSRLLGCRAASWHGHMERKASAPLLGSRMPLSFPTVRICLLRRYYTVHRTLTFGASPLRSSTCLSTRLRASSVNPPSWRAWELSSANRKPTHPMWCLTAVVIANKRILCRHCSQRTESLPLGTT